MARPLRLEFAGALYHVTSHGNRREMIFESDDDRRAYCLMSNHYHLLIETPGGNLSKGMRQLNGVYTQHFNRTHSRVGHVFRDGIRRSWLRKTVTYWSCVDTSF
jgi:REP element-mobilizing transposase RayT